MDIKSEAWRIITSKSEDSLHYRLQICNVNNKNSKKIARTMKGWRSTGEIVHVHDNTYDLLFDRSFESDSEWLSWAKGFPYPLDEINTYNDNVKRSGLSQRRSNASKSKQKRKKTKAGKVRKPTTCSKCGKPGHNARTCGTPAAKKASKNVRQCSWCCEYGHNKRTCPELQ